MANAIKRMIGYHRAWLDKHGTRILERDSKYLQEDIADGTPEAFRQIPAALDCLATYYGILGTVELIDGHERGWQHVATAIDFRGWELKIEAECYFRNMSKGLNLTNYVSRAACLICVSQKWGGIAESILSRANEDQEAIDQPFWNSRRFEPFVLACCLIRDGKKTIDYALKAPYRAIIDNWSDDKSLGDALEAVCEYHCENMDDVGGDWNPEFKHSPFDLLPCEVMFVKRVRKKLGLSMPNVSHQLASLLNAPDDIVAMNEEHELIKELPGAFERCFA